MTIKHLADETHALGKAGFLQDLMRPAFRMYDLDPQECDITNTAQIDISLSRADTLTLLAAVDALPECPARNVINVNCSGWHIIQIEGERTMISCIATVAETLGAERIVS